MAETKIIIMKAITVSAILCAIFILAILVLNSEHRREVEDLKTQIKSCESPGVVTFPDGEYIIIRYYPTEFIY